MGESSRAEVYLVRHAEDQAAAEQRFVDGPLSARGRDQATALARALARTTFDACWTSPLLRARQTAELALEGREVPLIDEPLLAEGALGALAGLAWARGAELHPKHFRIGRSVVARLAASGETAPGGETREAFLLRARKVASLLEQALRVGSGRTLVISHGGLLNFALQFLIDVRVRDEVPFGFDHCGVVRAVGFREAPDFGPFAMLRFGLPISAPGA